MCGILGGFSKDSGRLISKTVCDALTLISHRGPDHCDYHIDSCLVLGHTRLSIIDLEEKANQPFKKGGCILIFNGEIYNYQRLMKQLIGLGHQFTTQSDTEVLLTCYLEYGIACLDHLEGMFAFAIWDSRSQKFFVARDKFGEKPLFYLHNSNCFLFSSELRPIHLLSPEPLELDPNSLGLFFRLSYIPAPHSPFRDLHQLEPGHYVTFSPDRWELKQTCYYKLSKPPLSSLDYDDACSKLKQLVHTATKDRLFSSDLSVAVFLSGGIDSSIITGIVNQACLERTRAYTVTYPDNPRFDESHFADLLAKDCKNLEHIHIPITEQALIEFVDKTLSMLGEPYGDSSIVPTAYLCSQVSEKVILGGDGADELFGGYGIYESLLMSQRLPKLLKRLLRWFPHHTNPRQIKNAKFRSMALFYSNLRETIGDEFLGWRTYTEPRLIHSLGISSTDSLDKEYQDQDFDDLNDMLVWDIRHNLAHDMLKKVDYAGMMHGLEVRSPFLDSALVHFALSLPGSYKIKRGRRKAILKDAFAKDLPEGIRLRGKQGFLLPVREWFKSGHMRDQLQSLVENQTELDPTMLGNILFEHQRGNIDHSVFLWCLYTYFNWKTSIANVQYRHQTKTAQVSEAIITQ